MTRGAFQHSCQSPSRRRRCGVLRPRHAGCLRQLAPIPPQEEDSPSRDSCRQRRRCLAKKPHLPSPSNSSQPRHNHNLPPISCLWIISVGTGVPFATNLVAGWLHPLSTSSLSNLLGSPLPLLIVAACYISLLDLLSRLHQETHIRLL